MERAAASRAVLLSLAASNKRSRINVTHSIEVGPDCEAVWTTGNYSGISLDHVGKIVSPTFELNNQSYNLQLYPNGNDDKQHLGVFLGVPEAEHLPDGWSRKKMRLTLEVSNQLMQAKTVIKSSNVCLAEGSAKVGWQFMDKFSRCPKCSFRNR